MPKPNRSMKTTKKTVNIADLRACSSIGSIVGVGVGSSGCCRVVAGVFDMILFLPQPVFSQRQDALISVGRRAGCIMECSLTIQSFHLREQHHAVGQLTSYHP